jgi:CheY-like chemotaxis protein
MKSILYIEDSVTSQLIVRRILSGTFAVTIAPTPRAGNVLLDQNRYDLVITDFLFPQCDALDLIVPLRQSKPALEVPVIAVSSSMDSALINRLHKAGVNACRCKPLKPAEFLALVERMLQEPFLEGDSNSVCTVSCFQWFAQGAYHEFCPELQQHLTGTDHNDLSVRMLALITEHSGKGTPLGFTTRERVRAYLVQPGLIGSVDSTRSSDL